MSESLPAIFNDASSLTGQSSSMFSTNYSDCSFVFEFVPMDLAADFMLEAQFEPTTTNVGLPAVNAIASINVSADNFSRLFYMRTNDLTILPNASNASLNEIKYGILGNETLNVSGGVNPFTNISYSNASIHAGFANPAISFIGNTLLYQDYIRYTAKTITGGYALSDIFDNEGELLEAVGTMDASFATGFDELLTAANGYEDYIENLAPEDAAYPYVLACKTLITSLLDEASSANQSTAGYLRGQRFLEDLASQSDAYVVLNGTIEANVSGNVSYDGVSEAIYWVQFHPGDVLAVRLTYSPKNGSGNPASYNGENLGSNPIYDRSYKIYLRMD
jgi:hypothetical protein